MRVSLARVARDCFDGSSALGHHHTRASSQAFRGVADPEMFLTFFWLTVSFLSNQ